MGCFLTKFCKKKECKVLLLGLAGAGKTTLLYKCMKKEKKTIFMPTIITNVETALCKNVKMTVWDFGGYDKIVDLYHHYYAKTNAVVMVIDSSDRLRLDEFDRYVLTPIRDAEELTNSVFLFLLNKKDLPNTLNKDEVTARLDLQSIKQKWQIFETCFTRGDCVKDALDWLALTLRKSLASTKVQTFDVVQEKYCCSFLSMCTMKTKTIYKRKTDHSCDCII